MRAYEDITEEEVDRYVDNRIAGLEMRGEIVLPDDTHAREGVTAFREKREARFS
jgi:hypothetical protein